MLELVKSMSYFHENHGLVNKYDCFYIFIQNLRLKEIVTDVVEVFASSIFLVLMLSNSLSFLLLK